MRTRRERKENFAGTCLCEPQKCKSVQRLSPCVFEDVEASGKTVCSINQSVFIDDHVVHLNRVSGAAGGRRWDEVSNLFDLRGRARKGNRLIHQAVDANAFVEKGSDKGVLQVRGCRIGEIRSQIVSARTASS